MSWVIELCSVCRTELKSWHEMVGHMENCGHERFRKMNKVEGTFVLENALSTKSLAERVESLELDVAKLTLKVLEINEVKVDKKKERARLSTERNIGTF